MNTQGPGAQLAAAPNPRRACAKHGPPSVSNNVSFEIDTFATDRSAWTCQSAMCQPFVGSEHFPHDCALRPQPPQVTVFN